MQSFLTHVLTTAGVTVAALLAGAALLHLIPRLGLGGGRVAAALCRAPGLDLVVTYFTVAPLIVGAAVAGWAGLLGGVIGQVASVFVWQAAHEFAHRDAARGPRLVKVINRVVGRWRNHAAMWVTAIVTPMFWMVRVAEVALYPALTALVGLPPQRHAEWVNVSRQKFSGLVGHDLIWCLYCDWMTGVWSLGTEMLRNVESFWCPIRFASDKKCANCAIDFPDVNAGWVAAGGTMADVTATWDRMYAGGERAWFGRRVPLTVGGERLDRERQPVGATAGAATTALGADGNGNGNGNGKGNVGH